MVPRQSLYDPNNPEMAAKKAALDAMMPTRADAEPTPNPYDRHLMGSGGLGVPGGDVGDEAGYSGSGAGGPYTLSTGETIPDLNYGITQGKKGGQVAPATSGYSGPGIGVSSFMNTLSNNEQAGATDRYGQSPLFTNILEQSATPLVQPDQPENDLRDAIRATRTGGVSPYRRRALDSLLGPR